MLLSLYLTTIKENDFHFITSLILPILDNQQFKRPIMKRMFYIPLIIGSITFSCSNDVSNEKNSEQKNDQVQDKVVSKVIDLPDNPCEMISMELVTKHFDVSADSLEKDEYNREGVHWTESCAYKCKKADFDVINKRNQEKIMAAMKKGSMKDAVKAGKEVEQAHKHVGITNLREFDTSDEAQKYFKNSHKKPSKEDMEKLDQEFNKQADKKGLSAKQEEMGKSLSSGIADNLKFIEVDGIGDMASWDDLGSKLDVLVGTTQFGVKIHTGEGTEKDIEKAKSVAKDILSNF